MPTLLRSVEVTLTVDTNKRTTVETLQLGEDETIEEFAQRVRETLEGLVQE